MDIFREETEFTDIRMVHRVVNLFESCPGSQRRFRLGVVANMSSNEERDDTEESYGDWGVGRSSFTSYPNLSDWSSEGVLRGGSVYQLPSHYYPSSSGKVQPKESDAERRARLLEEVIKSKEKAEKKRIKKQKRKERKRLEKLEKEKLNPETNKEAGEAAQQSESEGSRASSDESKNKLPAAAKDSSSSSEEESSDEDSDTKKDSTDSEELDMSSSFVSKAAVIARRKLEQNPRPERRRRPPPTTNEAKSPPEKPEGAPEEEKQDCAPPTLENNVKISTDLAVTGNKFASAGDFNMAVKYFTDAIKYNPTEFKLFGNRSFCFEKSQQFEKALADAELCLSMNPGWDKAHFRRGRALAGLKRYEEAAGAFREVLSLDGSCAEAAQELMRVHITQLMEYGFTREQSSNALIIHGTVEKALEVLSALYHHPGNIQSVPFKPAQLVNISGVSPVLSANISPAPLPHLHPVPLHPPHAHNALQSLKNRPLVQNMSNIQSQQKIVPMKSGAEQELFPVWVGNLVYPLSEEIISNMFNKVGQVHSVKLLIYKRCAFVNYTKREHCDEAIRRLHGSELNGMKIAVRYPDRIPPGIGISRSALKSENLQDENMRLSAAGTQRSFRPSRPAPDFKGSHKF
ncbi:hypothetical protein PBY51_006027 [Eleginops maclovinus]|uniref:RRM domain-containing protein n=1 Tax=Eleginops maclovinus TaxID=56733 RepID=A0AAN7WWA6_ELEMC|nr:hypothetical protein PBY51_006027 [Eleginops maclovinus]